jgi:hypothetical protein
MRFHFAGAGREVQHPDLKAGGVAGEVVGVDLDRLPAGRPLAPDGLEIADQLLLLGVNADHRLTGRKGRRDGVVDVLELRVAVGVLGTLAGLDVGLHRVPDPAQQPQHRTIDDLVPQPTQPVGELGCAL